MDNNTRHLVAMSCKFKEVIENLKERKDEVDSQLMCAMEDNQSIACNLGLVTKRAGKNVLKYSEKGKIKIKTLTEKLLLSGDAFHELSKPSIEVRLAKGGK